MFTKYTNIENPLRDGYVMVTRCILDGHVTVKNIMSVMTFTGFTNAQNPDCSKLGNLNQNSFSMLFKHNTG